MKLYDFGLTILIIIAIALIFGGVMLTVDSKCDPAVPCAGCGCPGLEPQKP